MCAEYARDLLGGRLGFAVAQPHLATLRADHKLLRLPRTQYTLQWRSSGMGKVQGTEYKGPQVSCKKN